MHRWDMLWQDLRYAARSLRHSRSFSVGVVGSLAIGMAIAIAAFALLISSLMGPFPEVAEQERLVRVTVTQNCGRPDCWSRMSSAEDYKALQEGLAGLQSLAAYTQGTVAAVLPKQAQAMRALLTSPNYFKTLGVRAAAGRLFDASDERTQARVAVIAHSVWMRELESDPAAIGRSIRIGDELVQIVGIAPPLFAGIDQGRPGQRGPEIWLPLWLADRVLPVPSGGQQQRRQERDIYFVGRLRDGIEVTQLQAEAEVMAQRLAAQHGESSPLGRADVRRVWRVNPENWQFGIVIVMPIPVLVLVIACVNAANLLLARGSQRKQEIAVRLAIGAARGRIVRQLLFESFLLALAATAIAVPAAWWALQLVSTPLSIPIAIDRMVLAFAIVTAVGTTLAFGFAPAVRLSAQQPSSTIGTASTRSDANPRQSRMRRFLVMAQVALSIGLLATAWQLVGTVRAQAVSGGTPADRLLIARFDLRPLNLAEGGAEEFYRNLVAGAARLPGVEAVGVARHSSVWTFGQGTGPASVTAWLPDDDPDEGRVTIGGYAGGELFGAVGLRTLAGRGFTEADRQSRPQVAIVNRAFAERMQGPAVGAMLRVAPRNQDFNTALDVRIVGVIEPAVEPRYAQDGLLAPKIYLPAPIEPEPALALYVRTHGKAAGAAQALRELVSRLDPRVPIAELGSLHELNERSFAAQLWLARGASFLGVVGLLLATAGLYGVSSYVVALRSREIAIRMAVGAKPTAILMMILRQSMRVALIGLVIGGAIAAAASRVIQSGYHGIQNLDVVAFAGAAALFLAVMLVASAIPAVRASRVDPVKTLNTL